MKSIAIWCSISDREEPIYDDVELHFNFWKLPSRNQYNRVLDIGVMLDNTKNIDNMFIYFPVCLQKSNIADIVSKFINDNDLVCTIFNENYKTTNDPRSKMATISNSSDAPLFRTYSLDVSDYEVESRYGGSILSIKLPKCDVKIYFRIRIDKLLCNSLVNTQRPTNAFIQSAFSKIELTDFRVNDARDLDKSLLEEIARHKQLRISKGHFFYMVSSNEEVLNYHTPFVSCRKLETDKWNGYVEDHSLSQTESILAYHWKETNVPHFNILIKSKYESNNWMTILCYLTGLCVMSLLFGLLNWLLFTKYLG